MEGPLPEPLVTLAVPTFDRPEFLDALLASVEAEVRRDPALETALEVVVSDNASGPATAAVARRFEARLPATVRYRRNDANVGGPANLLLAVEAARGTYAMYVGDDDRLRPGAGDLLREVLLRHDRPPVCVFAHPWFLGAERAALPPEHDARLGLEEAARGYFFATGIPGGAAVRTDLARRVLAGAGRELLLRSNWPQTVLAYLAAAASGEDRPIAVRHAELANVSEHHDENTIYTAWIVWSTWVEGLLAAARVVAEARGPAFLGAACEDVFTARRIAVPEEKAVDHLLLVDSPEEAARFAERLEATLPGIPPAFRALPEELVRLARTPRGRRLWTLVRRRLLSRPGEVLRRPKLALRRLQSFRRLLVYRHRHRRKVARYAAGAAKGVRDYSREGY